MIEFARTVFGDDFDESSVVTETRMTFDEWAGGVDETINRLVATGVMAATGLAEAPASQGRQVRARLVQGQSVRERPVRWGRSVPTSSSLVALP